MRRCLSEDQTALVIPLGVQFTVGLQDKILVVLAGLFRLIHAVLIDYHTESVKRILDSTMRKNTKNDAVGFDI